jgi:hypothetical protein
VIREELTKISTWEDRHRRLLARLAIVAMATLVVDAVFTVFVYFAERHAANTDIVSVGDAAFFTTTQLLTISSSVNNPITGLGQVIDVVLEIWGVLVVAGSTGAVAAFFLEAN